MSSRQENRGHRPYSITAPDDNTSRTRLPKDEDAEYDCSGLSKNCRQTFPGIIDFVPAYAYVSPQDAQQYFFDPPEMRTAPKHRNDLVPPVHTSPHEVRGARYYLDHSPKHSEDRPTNQSNHWSTAAVRGSEAQRPPYQSSTRSNHSTETVVSGQGKQPDSKRLQGSTLPRTQMEYSKNDANTSTQTVINGQAINRDVDLGTRRAQELHRSDPINPRRARALYFTRPENPKFYSRQEFEGQGPMAAPTRINSRDIAEGARNASLDNVASLQALHSANLSSTPQRYPAMALPAMDRGNIESNDYMANMQATEQLPRPRPTYEYQSFTEPGPSRAFRKSEDTVDLLRKQTHGVEKGSDTSKKGEQVSRNDSSPPRASRSNGDESIHRPASAGAALSYRVIERRLVENEVDPEQADEKLVPSLTHSANSTSDANLGSLPEPNFRRNQTSNTTSEPILITRSSVPGLSDAEIQQLLTSDLTRPGIGPQSSALPYDPMKHYAFGEGSHTRAELGYTGKGTTGGLPCPIPDWSFEYPFRR